MVLLRRFVPDDQYRLAILANNVKIWNNVRDRLPHPYTPKHAKLFINYYKDMQPATTLAIEVEGKLAGSIGIDLQEDISRISAEIGYWIGEPFWNSGVATTALKNMTAYAFQNFSFLIRLYAKVFENNTASMRVLEKAGFVHEGIQRKSAIKNGRIMDEHIWVMFREGVNR